MRANVLQTKYQIFLFIATLLCLGSVSKAQLSPDSIKKDYIENSVSYLASNKLKGRVNFTPEQMEATEWLGHEFALDGLEPFPGYSNYYLPFSFSPASASIGKLSWNSRWVDDSLFTFIPSRLVPAEATLDEFMIIQAGYPIADSLLFFHWRNKVTKTLVWIKLPDSVSYSEATRNIVIPRGMPVSDILVVCNKEEPVKLAFSPNKNQVNSVLYNIIGMIPGDSLPDEAVIFSAHYDHVDRGLMGETGEIFNGANDDASGTAAVLALARYYAQRNDNRRTLVFCLFSGEELGLEGSKAFVNKVATDKIVAMLNIEMIGMHNATGKDAFMLTGSNYSDVYRILSRNLADEKFRVYELSADPYQLFERSDNYSFAYYGVPAHSIMCSDDHEPCYHKPCDDAKRIDFENMTNVVRAIALSAETIINGKDTPSRIKK